MRYWWMAVALVWTFGTAQLLYMTLLDLSEVGWINLATLAMVLVGYYWILKGAWIRARRKQQPTRPHA